MEQPDARQSGSQAVGMAVPGTQPLKRLRELGQSVWLDFMRRDLYTTGQLARLIREDGLRGMTSNPTIFQKAIAGTDLYDAQIRSAARWGLDPAAIFESLAVEDVRSAADVLRPVYEATGGDDGFVSIEVRPQLAHDTEGSIVEARRLWNKCGRPNVMVKIPATTEGLEVIRRCISEGININVTLLFSVPRYREVMEAFLTGVEERVAAGKPVDRLRSVASFFVSRVDTLVDAELDRIAALGADGPKAFLAWKLRGKLAIANARLGYQAFREVFSSPRFRELARKGVQLQRPLWASTSTKDPAYPALYYVEALVALDSIDTMPPETLEAYRHHGDPRIRIDQDLPGARAVFRQLGELGLDEEALFRRLEEEGIRKFIESNEAISRSIEDKLEELGVRVGPRFGVALGGNWTAPSLTRGAVRAHHAPGRSSPGIAGTGREPRRSR
jgi:transaldolase